MRNVSIKVICIDTPLGSHTTPTLYLSVHIRITIPALPFSHSTAWQSAFQLSVHPPSLSHSADLLILWSQAPCKLCLIRAIPIYCLLSWELIDYVWVNSSSNYSKCRIMPLKTATWSISHSETLCSTRVTLSGRAKTPKHKEKWVRTVWK